MRAARLRSATVKCFVKNTTERSQTNKQKTEFIARFCFYKVAVLLDKVVCFEIVNVVVVEFYAVGVSAE